MFWFQKVSDQGKVSDQSMQSNESVNKNYAKQSQDIISSLTINDDHGNHHHHHHQQQQQHHHHHDDSIQNDQKKNKDLQNVKGIHYLFENIPNHIILEILDYYEQTFYFTSTEQNGMNRILAECCGYFISDPSRTIHLMLRNLKLFYNQKPILYHTIHGLRGLNVSGWVTSGLDQHTLFTLLKKNPILRSLSVPTVLNPGEWSKLVQSKAYLPCLKHLESLHLTNENLKSFGMNNADLCDILSNFQSLKYLSISRFDFTEEAFINLLQSSINPLKSISIHFDSHQQNTLSNRVFSTLLNRKEMLQNKTLRSMKFHVQSNFIFDSPFSIMVCNCFQSLQSLEISQTSALSASVMAQLFQHKSLEKLSLTCLASTPEMIQSLSHLGDTSLCSASLKVFKFNCVTAVIPQLVVQNLVQNKTISTLHLHGVEFENRDYVLMNLITKMQSLDMLIMRLEPPVQDEKLCQCIAEQMPNLRALYFGTPPF